MPSRVAPRFGARRFCCSIIIYECSSKNAFVFSRAGIFCPAGAEGRAAPPRNRSARRPNVRICPPSRSRLCRRRGKALRARTGFFRSQNRPQALSRTEIYCKKGNLLKNTAVFFGYPVPAAYARSALHGRAGVGRYAARWAALPPRGLGCALRGKAGEAKIISE